MVNCLPKSLLCSLVVLLSLSTSLCQTVVPPRQLPQFHHTLWSADSGIGAVYDIQQAPDGFLWIQTSTGVFRFDGVRFQTAAELIGDAERTRKIEAALPSHSSGVWFTTTASGLLLWRGGHLKALPDTHCTGIIAESQDGSLWVASKLGLYHVHGFSCEKVGAEMAYPGGEPAGIMMDHEGTLWVKTWTGDLLSLAPGSSEFVRSPYGGGPTRFAAFLHEAPDQSVWLSDDYGIREVRGSRGATFVPRTVGKAHDKGERFQDFDFGEDGSVWLITDKGLRLTNRIEQWATRKEMEQSPGTNFTAGDGLNSDTIWADLIDHEGNVWLGTDAGLEQLRRVALYTPKLASAQEHELGIASGEAGSVWTGSLSLPLTRLDPTGVRHSFPSIGQIVTIHRDHNGVLWAASEGSAHLQRSSPTGFVQVHYPGEEKQAVMSLAVDRKKDLWISLRQLGILRLTDGKWVNEDASIGKDPTSLGAMTDDEAGNVWIIFEDTLVRWDGTRFSTFTLPNGPQGISVSNIMVRRDRVWLAGDDGVGLFMRGQFRLLHCNDDKLLTRVTRILEANDGDLWMNGASGVTHIKSNQLSKWIDNPKLPVLATQLDKIDGLPGLSGEIFPTPSVAQSDDGWIWFGTTKGISGLDPTTLNSYRNNVPPPVVISSVSSDGKIYQDLNGLRLPPNPKNLQVDYTALSFSIPERVRFRYKLDGVDDTWQDAGTRRQAFYNGLSPGKHRFHVVACNNDGVWNEAGATLLFSVAPAFYQTWWFRILLVAAATFFVWLLIRLRLRVLFRDLQGRLAERLEERERIARELHDTLLQGLFGLMLRLQFSLDQLPDAHPVRSDMMKALAQSDLIMQDGRERIKNLRSGHVPLLELADALKDFGQQLQSVMPIQFEVSSDGQPYKIDPYVHDEIFMIGREALANAFRHSRASTIKMTVSYRLRGFQLQVQDNGRGIDHRFLESGMREDHWGLPNMQERARKMHGTLRIEMPKGGGTLVELYVPGSIIYKGHRTLKHRLRLLLNHGAPLTSDTASGSSPHQETSMDRKQISTL